MLHIAFRLSVQGQTCSWSAYFNLDPRKAVQQSHASKSECLWLDDVAWARQFFQHTKTTKDLRKLPGLIKRTSSPASEVDKNIFCSPCVVGAATENLVKIQSPWRIHVLIMFPYHLLQID